MSYSTGNILSGAALGLVVLVLFAGLFNMLRGGSTNLSQRLMRLRVGLQFFAIVVMMAVLYFRHPH